MAEIHRSVATLRISGDHLIPNYVSALIKGTPSLAHAKNQPFTHPKTEIATKRNFGTWQLYSKDRIPSDLDGQISELLEQLTQNLDDWKRLASEFKIDLFVGLMMKSDNEGIGLSAKTMSELGARGIELDLDIYGPELA